jgi:NAD(P)-dependent dehydrogenase (short-subunit alcohol dehydrogenase family)
MWVPFEGDDPDELVAALERALDDYEAWYRAYYEDNLDDETRPFPLDPPGPRVTLIPGVGMVTAGRGAAKADVSRQLYHRAIAVMGLASAAGGFSSLTEREAFRVEYWPLERYKLTLAPAPAELDGRVAVVTGGAGGIGRAIAEGLAARGAHVAVLDLDPQHAREVADAIVERHGARRALAAVADVTDEAAVAAAFRSVVLEWGGVDVVVANAGLASAASVLDTSVELWDRNLDVLARGYFLTARTAVEVMRRQGQGGALVFVVSKNALAAGKGASAYSAAKAAELHLARCLAEELGGDGIRVNCVNPDAVVRGSGIFTSAWREERARGYGIEPDELEEFYRRRTALGVNVFAEDVAEAVLVFAGDRLAKTTGNLLNVDGGVAAAYPR